MSSNDGKTRCFWATKTVHEKVYHDQQWGVPVHDDLLWFEMLTLEGAQAGLSWSTILLKRDGYHQAFDAFDYHKISRYNDNKISALVENGNIIRNKLKIKSVVTNAKAFLKVIEEFGSFDVYIWQFVNGKPIQNQWQTAADVPASTPESEKLSKDLKKRGFKFVGPTICYALMQSAGMVNDHTTDCFRHQELR